MKLLTTLILSCATLIASAQEFKPDNNTVSAFKDQPAHLLDTVITSTLTKQQLYSNSLSYISSSFRNSKKSIESKDLELGELSFVGSAIVSVQDSSEQKLKKKTVYVHTDRDLTLHFKCRIYVKNQKAKIVLSSLKYDYYISDDQSIRIAPTRSDVFKGNDVAATLAIDIIKDIASSLNKKPENEF